MNVITLFLSRSALKLKPLKIKLRNKELFYGDVLSFRPTGVFTVISYFC